MRTRVHVTHGRDGRPVAVILPGTGSTADFVTRAFGPALDAAGLALASADPDPGPRVVHAAFGALDEAAARYDVRLVGGVSLGAQVAVRWAARRTARRTPLDGLLLALPAWTGRPGAVAAASTRAAGRLRADGLADTLADIRRRAVPWVAEEVIRAWPRYGGALADTLDAAASSPGPDRSELRGIGVPVGLVAFVDDPLHPADVAERWHATLARSSLRRLALADCAPGPAALGHATVAAWLDACRDHRPPAGW
ncbi:MAG TPA: alpha/beta hydrolase [Mycobacteriales bacterium]|nr:alpha/beta hydrolase [Mycobacteriales bacterium]